MSSLFPNAWTIARREYEQRVRSRIFVIVTALLAVLGIGLALLPLAIRAAGGNEPVAVAIYSADPRLASESATSLTHLLAAGQGQGEAGFAITVATSVDEGRAEVRTGPLDGLLTITRGADGELSFDIFTEDGPTSRTLLAIRSAAAQVNIGDRLARAGVDPARAGQIFAPTPFSITPLDPAAHDPTEDFGSGYILTMAS